MKVSYIVYLHLILLSSSWYITTAPLIQKIINDTDFGFVVLTHSDNSECSLRDKSVIIEPRTSFTQEFLIELGEPSLVLRPVYYQDPIQHQKAWLTDDQKPFDYKPLMVEQAFQLYRTQKNGSKCRNDYSVWLNNWIGQDLFVIPHQVEMLGYLLDLSRIVVVNNRHRHVQWLSFSKGIFSKLVLELQISQSKSKGIQAKIKILHGEGGVCTQGMVERL